MTDEKDTKIDLLYQQQSLLLDLLESIATDDRTPVDIKLRIKQYLDTINQSNYEFARKYGFMDEHNDIYNGDLK